MQVFFKVLRKEGKYHCAGSVYKSYKRKNPNLTRKASEVIYIAGKSLQQHVIGMFLANIQTLET